MLTIPEEVLLLHEAVWGPLGARKLARGWVDGPLAAGRLVELILLRRVTVEAAGRYLLRRDVIQVSDATPTGDALLDDVVERLTGSKLRSPGYWVDHTEKGCEPAYWDRLVSSSLIRRDDLSDAPTAHVADPDVVAATTDRIRAVLANPESTDLRDVALVTLLAHSQNMTGLFDGMKLTPAALVRRYRAERREEKTGRRAVGNYIRFVESAPDLDTDERHWATAAARSIELIAEHTAPPGWEGGG